MRIIIETSDAHGAQLSGMFLEVDMETYNAILNLIDDDSSDNSEEVCKLIVKHAVSDKVEFERLLSQIKGNKTKMNIFIPIPIDEPSQMIYTYKEYLEEAVKENILKSLQGLTERQRVEILNDLLNNYSISEP